MKRLLVISTIATAFLLSAASCKETELITTDILISSTCVEGAETIPCEPPVSTTSTLVCTEGSENVPCVPPVSTPTTINNCEGANCP